MPLTGTPKKMPKKTTLTVHLYPEDKARLFALAAERGQNAGLLLSALIGGREPSSLPPDCFAEILSRLREVCRSLGRLADAAEAGILPPDGKYERDLETVQNCIGDLIREGYGG